MREFLKNYTEHIKGCLDSLPFAVMEQVVEMLEKTIREGKQIFIFGNGACAAASSHFVCDLVKGCIVEGVPRVKAFSLNDCVPLMTAWANDESYESVFVEPLKNYLGEEDLVIGISASGNSPNVFRAIEYANGKGAITIGLAGKGGGKLAGLADLVIVVSSDSYEEVEDVHVIIIHMLKLALIKKLSK